MSGQCIDKVEIDGHTVQLFDDDGKITGYSFSQDKYYSDPLDQLPKDYKPVRIVKTAEEKQQELDEIATYQTLALPSRSVSKEALEHFGVKVGVSQEDGETPTTVHFPYRKGAVITGWETKLLDPKKFWRVGDTEGVDFFGWEEAISSGSPKVFITEGPLDAVSLYQVFKENSAGGKWSHLTPATVSIPNGAGSAKGFILSKLTELNRHFDSIVLVFDMDEPGAKAAEEVVKVLPEATVADLPTNDVNQCLMEGRVKACAKAVLWQAAKLKNTRLLAIESLFQKARTPVPYGYSYPWESVTELTRGIHLGQTIYITAPEKVGKSELLNAIAVHCIVEHDLKCLLMKPEEDPAYTVKMLAGKVEGKFFNDPSKEFDYKAYDHAASKLAGKVEILDVYQDLSWETMQIDIRSAATDGCSVIFVDPLTAATTGLSSSDANTKLQEIAQGLSTMAKDLNIAIFIFTHTRNPKSGLAFNRGGRIEVGDITGGRAMGRSAHQVFALQSNQDPDLPEEERNIRELVLLADRNMGAIGVTKLYWDKLTSLFKELV